MKKSSIFAGCLLLVGSLFAATACSSDDSNSSKAGVATGLDQETAAVRDQLEQLYKSATAAGEKTVNVYTLAPDEFSKRNETGLGKIAALFEKSFPGITVKPVDGSVIAESTAAEKASGKYVGDVVLHGDTEVDDLKTKGYLEKFTPAGASNLAHPEYSDPDGYAYSPFHLYNGVLYNTSELTEKDVPRTWAQLADPKWKGQFLIVAANGVTSLRTYANLVYNKKLGPAEQNYLKQILANGTVTNTFSDVLTKVIEGDYKFSIFGPGSGTLKSKARGLPIDFADSVLTLHNNLWSAVSAHAPHPNAAKLFDAFQFSLAAQNAYATDSFYLPNAKGSQQNKYWPEVTPQEKLIPFGVLGKYSQQLAPEFEALYAQARK
ncbi:MAG: extracellular solute-binding protein [Gordonia sp. (in: high G+C Gram-positive bacteria)]